MNPKPQTSNPKPEITPWFQAGAWPQQPSSASSSTSPSPLPTAARKKREKKLNEKKWEKGKKRAFVSST
eukprot:3278448-Rhodomonas_salina.1